MDENNKAPAGPGPFDRETEAVWRLLYRYLWLSRFPDRF